MDIEPAHIDQIRRARDGRFVTISADAGGVVEDLKRIDPGLGVRFAEHGDPPFWAVYHKSEDGRSTQLVLTAQAWQTNSGVWEGLDQRIVRRVEQIGHGSYDLAADLEQRNRLVASQRRERFRDTISASAEEGAHALRRDLGVKSRAFIKGQ